jgi:hypothetical protein
MCPVWIGFAGGLCGLSGVSWVEGESKNMWKALSGLGQGNIGTLLIHTSFHGIFIVGFGRVLECLAKALYCYVFCLGEFLHLYCYVESCRSWSLVK